MPRARKLSWFEAKKRWRKYYRGKMYYPGTVCKGKTDQEGYDKAWADWLETKGKIDNTPEPLGIDPALTLPMATDYDKVSLSKPPSTRTEKGDGPIDVLIDVFLDKMRQRVAKDERTVKMHAELRAKLDDFFAYAKKHHPTKTLVSQIDADLLGDYQYTQHELTLKTKSQGGVSPSTVKKRLATLQRWMRWLYKTEKVDQLPRMLERPERGQKEEGFAYVEIKKEKPIFWTVEEVRILFNAASRRMKVLIALALNCGFTQIDCSTLTHDMIDWNTGILSRLRNKTKIPGQWKLWPVTQELLKLEMTKRKQSQLGEFVLMGAKGNNLVHLKLKDDGMYVTVASGAG